MIIAAVGPLPVERFDAVPLSNHRVDTKARVSVRSVYYSVPAGLVRRRVDVMVRAETIEIYDRAKLVATHDRGHAGRTRRFVDDPCPRGPCRSVRSQTSSRHQILLVIIWGWLCSFQRKLQMLR